MNSLGRLLINGENAMERDIPRAADVFSKAIVEGNDTDALTYFIATPPDRGWQRNEGLLLLHSFLSLDIFCGVLGT